MERREKEVLLYTEARNYLLKMMPSEMKIEDLDKWYLTIEPRNCSSIDEIFDRLIGSAQNAQGMPNAIAYNGGNRKAIVGLLGDGHLPSVKKLARMDRSSEIHLEEIIYGMFCEEFSPRKPEARKNLWYRWSRAVADSALFLDEFEDAEDFYRFAEMFTNPKEAPKTSRPYIQVALPIMLSQRIRGVGFALACDFLKGLGYANYPKPDVHLKDIFFELGFVKRREDYPVYEAAVSAAETAAEEIDDSPIPITPYALDKTIWLICSGRFYEVEGWQEQKVDGQKDNFIKHMRPLLMD